jgi:DivIVA domain-containing protein
LPDNRKDERMDWNDIDRLRDPGFTLARRGYDRREVDRLLGSVADWLETDAVKEIEELSVKRKLEHVGKSTARILVTAEEESEKLRHVTQEECAQLREDAEAAALSMRMSADEYAQRVRAKAEADAEQTVQEAEDRRAQVEAAVSELEARRDRTIAQLDRLRAELSAAIEPHESGDGAVLGA